LGQPIRRLHRYQEKEREINQKTEVGVVEEGDAKFRQHGLLEAVLTQSRLEEGEDSSEVVRTVSCLRRH
jgi:hypothetical protein